MSSLARSAANQAVQACHAHAASAPKVKHLQAAAHLLPQQRRRLANRRPCSAASGAADAGAGTSSSAGSSGPGAQQQLPIDTTYVRLDRVGEPEEGMDPKVAEALKRVQSALADAEQSMQQLHTLPSARLPTLWDRVLAVLRPVGQFAALAAYCTAIHSLGTAVRVLGSLAVGLGVAVYGWRRSSLSRSGAVAAALVGWGTLGASFRAGLLLLTFFFTSSKITQLGEELKDVDEDHKKGGQRDWKQVACNALVPTGLALAAAYYSGTGGADLALGEAAPAGSDATRLLTALHAAFLGYYSCCCGDTWSSELGQLSPQEPRLITTLRPVKKGTNGGVTLLGLGAALAGGLAMGLTFWLASLVSPTGSGLAGPATRQWQLVALGVGAGLVGSLIDSLLGATIQFTGYNRVTGKITGRPGPDVSPISGFPVLDNNMVNAVSASATAALTAAFAALTMA